jgi:hypothetical protein
MPVFDTACGAIEGKRRVISVENAEWTVFCLTGS